ncbi:hypothetical protein [Kocuria oceani]|uniref:Uncharacterized protein n=1 Tax=Kocuria oceani TaxID=988827 RepID=A0ABV9TQK2_9MICC|nr:hypothetical protein [Kocuria oceani]
MKATSAAGQIRLHRRIACLALDTATPELAGKRSGQLLHVMRSPVPCSAPLRVPQRGM